MNKAYIEKFCKTYDFPQDATDNILNLYSGVEKNGEYISMIHSAEEVLFSEERVEPEKYLDILDNLAEKMGKSKYEVKLLFHIASSERLCEMYDKKGIDEKIRFATLEDIFFKMMECYGVTGIYGLYTPAYLYGYYRVERFAFGRMQFEIAPLPHDAKIGDIELKEGDKAIRLHIPACKKPFDKESRLDSYKKAYNFFKSEFETDKIPFTCTSWLLGPVNEEFLSPKSNIIEFMHEFNVVSVCDNQNYHSFRIFGMPCPENLSHLPEDTSLRRGMKKRMIEGTGIQTGCGVFLFDGEKIIV